MLLCSLSVINGKCLILLNLFTHLEKITNYSPDSVCLAFAVAALGENLNLIFQIKNSGMSGIRPSAYPSFFFFFPSSAQL